MPGIKGEARRAAHDRPLGRALLRRLGKEFLSEVRHHKAPKPGPARAHPAALRCPLTSRVERIAAEAAVRREVSVKPHPAPDPTVHPGPSRPIASPLLASALIASYGPDAMFLFIALAHLVLAGLGLLRMRARPTMESRTDFVAVPPLSPFHLCRRATNLVPGAAVDPVATAAQVT